MAALSTTLASRWDGLNSHLIASFYVVTKDNNGKWVRPAEGQLGHDPHTVKAPLTDANLEVSLNWQSPFENMGPESKAPTLLAMLQSGQLLPWLDLVAGSKITGQIQSSVEETLRGFQGRTGITKLNSTQVFNGMPPIKITCNAVFRAWASPQQEVELPFEKLMEWSLPVKLEEQGSTVLRAVQAAKTERSILDALMPSQSPVQIAMEYKRKIYSPLVIESIGQPLDSPIDSSGRFVELTVPLTLCTLTALGRSDWAGMMQKL